MMDRRAAQPANLHRLPFGLLLVGVAVAGVVVGGLASWAVHRGDTTPPALPSLASVDPSVPLPAGGTATALSLLPPPAVGDAPDGAATAAATAAAEEPPSESDAAATLQAPTLAPGSSDPAALRQLRRGEGAFVIVDLGAVGMKSLLVRAGTLRRDGPVDAKALLKAPKVHVLRGPLAKVELLHFGYDAEAQPVVAHVRTVARPEGDVEGIMAVRLQIAGQAGAEPLLAWLPMQVDPAPPVRAVPVPEPAAATDASR